MDERTEGSLRSLSNLHNARLQAEIMGSDRMSATFNAQIRDGLAGEDEHLENQGKEQLSSCFDNCPEYRDPDDEDVSTWTAMRHVSTAITEDASITALRFREANDLRRYRRSMVTKTGKHVVLHFQGDWEFKVWQAHGRTTHTHTEIPVTHTETTNTTPQKIGGVTGARATAPTKHAHL